MKTATADALDVIERKIFSMKITEAKEEDEGKVGSFTGIANVMGVVDLQDEVIEIGAFDETLKEQDGIVILLADHNTSGATRLGSGR